MELGRFIRTGIAASAAGHLSILAMVLIFAEVHPFASVTAESIAVDIVSPEEAVQVPKMPEPEPKSQGSDAFDPSLKSAPAASSVPQQAASPAPAAPASSQPDRREAAAQRQAPSTSPVLAYIPPEPDLSITFPSCKSRSFIQQPSQIFRRSKRFRDIYPLLT